MWKREQSGRAEGCAMDVSAIEKAQAGMDVWGSRANGFGQRWDINWPWSHCVVEMTEGRNSLILTLHDRTQRNPFSNVSRQPETNQKYWEVSSCTLPP